jgi:peptidoglycan-associated lipoprotein
MKKLLLISVLALSVIACSETTKPDDDTIAENDNIENAGATAGAIDGDAGLDGKVLEGGKQVSYEEDAINNPDNVLSGKLIYFAYDSNKVGDDYIELAKHHGRYLSFNVNATVRLEGHADERGTREYNVALAEARAQAVKQLMLYEGAGNDQISVISYGEEKPVAFGHDEESMSLNRRVEIVYQ